MSSDRAAELYREIYNKYADRLLEHRRSRDRSFFNRCIEAPVVRELLPRNLAGRRVIDIGCGVGDLTGWLLEQGAFVKAVDCSEEVIAVAKAEQRSPRVDFEVVPFEELAEEESSYDHAVASFMLGYFPSLDRFFGKLGSLLAPDGTSIVSMLHPIRACATGRVEDGYVLRKYFQQKIYKADFLGSDAVIPLHAWKFSEVVESASSSNLLLDALHEPRLTAAPQEDFDEFYGHSPSVAVMRFRRVGRR